MWQILPDLFLGDRGDAGDRDRLRASGVTHVVNCSKELPCQYEDEFAYLWLRMEDPDPRFAALLPAFCAFIDDGRRGGKVMVHCTGAVSRSPTVILAYPWHHLGDWDAAVDHLRRAEQTGIDEDFLRQFGRAWGVAMTAGDVEA